MAFWKKPVELPEKFYDALGQCSLASLECGVLARRFDPISLTPAQACELLDAAKNGLLDLQATIGKYPIKSDKLMEIADLSEWVQSCDEKKQAIMSTADLSSGEQFWNYDGDYIGGMDIAQFVRAVFAAETMLGLMLRKAASLMAKGANISLDALLTRAMDRAKKSPRGKAFLASQGNMS